MIIIVLCFAANSTYSHHIEYVYDRSQALNISCGPLGVYSERCFEGRGLLLPLYGRPPIVSLPDTSECARGAC